MNAAPRRKTQEQSDCHAQKMSCKMRFQQDGARLTMLLAKLDATEKWSSCPVHFHHCHSCQAMLYVDLTLKTIDGAVCMHQLQWSLVLRTALHFGYIDESRK